MRCMRVVIALLAIGLVVPVAAGAADYPSPGKPGKVKPRPGGTKTFTVCTAKQVKQAKRAKRAPRGCSATIQAAVDRTLPGDTVRIPAGRYRQSVSVLGHKHDGIKLIGTPANPRKTVLDLAGLSKDKRQNAVFINGADGVAVRGLYARNFLGNGFFALNVTGYLLKDLVAGWGGTYGIYAFNSKGGTIADSEAFYNNDSGFYIGQTPVQSRPLRSIVRNVTSWGNQLGYSGTNMRYVTITRSRFYNNGLGIVPNALDSEKFAPPEHNVVTDNDVFWNNFDYFRGAPFTIRAGAKGLSYPVGVGIMLYGSRDTIVEKNRVFGNFLAGVALVDAIELKQKDAAAVKGNTVRANVFGRDGTDLNAADLFYPGEVVDTNTGNCFADNVGVHATVPADGSTFEACPFSGVNAKSADGLRVGLGWITDPTHERYWVKHSHPAYEGIVPLEHYTGRRSQ
jgi:parallel beta-helix repeat protein